MQFANMNIDKSTAFKKYFDVHIGCMKRLLGWIGNIATNFKQIQARACPWSWYFLIF